MKKHHFGLIIRINYFYFYIVLDITVKLAPLHKVLIVPRSTSPTEPAYDVHNDLWQRLSF